MVTAQQEQKVQQWVEWARLNARLCLVIAGQIIGGRCGEFPLDVTACTISESLMVIEFSDRASLKISDPDEFVLRQSVHVNTHEILEVASASVVNFEYWADLTHQRLEEIYRFNADQVERQYTGPPRRFLPAHELLRYDGPAVRLVPDTVRVDGRWRIVAD